MDVKHRERKRLAQPELRNCVKVEVALPVSGSPYGLCGRKATLNLNRPSIRMMKKKMVPQSEEGEANLFTKEMNVLNKNASSKEKQNKQNNKEN